MANYAYASENPLAADAELVSLVLIVAAFVVITYLTAKTRSRKSFQFEMFLFSLVLVAAEVPRVLYSLHVIDIDALSTIGLEIHSVSMVIITGFVLFRVRGFVSTSHALRTDFKGVVQGAIENGITSGVGAETMKAMNFYVQSQMAVVDPDGYAKSLRKIFGSGAGVLLDAIVRSICEATKVERREGMSLADAIEAGNQNFLSTGSPLRQ